MSVKDMFIKKYSSQKWKRGPSCSFSFFQVVFPVLSYVFPVKIPIFQFISVKDRHFFSLHSFTFLYFLTVILPPFPLISRSCTTWYVLVSALLLNFHWPLPNYLLPTLALWKCVTTTSSLQPSCITVSAEVCCMYSCAWSSERGSWISHCHTNIRIVELQSYIDGISGDPLVQPSTRRCITANSRWKQLGLCPVKSWKSLRIEVPEFLWESCPSAMLSLLVKFFRMRSPNLPATICACWTFSYIYRYPRWVAL